MEASERYAVAKAGSVALTEASVAIEEIQNSLIGVFRRSLFGRTPLTVPILAAVQAGTALTHKAVRSLAWAGSDVLAPALHATAPANAPKLVEGPKGANFVAAMSCAFGDHLASSPETAALTTPMSLQHEGRALSVGAYVAIGGSVKPKVCVFVHGLGHTEKQWGPELVSAVRDEGFLPLFTRYNTGLHIGENGRALAQLVHEIEEEWPIPLDRVMFVGHSMGALVSRSACEQSVGSRVHHLISDLVSLGAPHRGSPVERVASYALSGLTKHGATAPLARLGNRRSAGIKDLRHGTIRLADWHGHHPDDILDDRTQTVTLPSHIAHRAFAATLSANPRSLRTWIMGDGIVRVNSARPLRESAAGEDVSVTVLTNSGHLSLLNHPTVANTLRETAASRPHQPAG